MTLRLGLISILLSISAFAETVHYELTATRGSVNLSGQQTVNFALMLNGSIPAPTLHFNEGDTAEILVKNRIPGEEVSIHWHGLLLPNEQDGVPYVTTAPIPSGADHVFRFTLRQSGTYWYHSHTHVQEQKGLYGALVIHPKKGDKGAIRVDREAVVVLSDWSDENADQILRNLRKDGDYYLYKKNRIRSWWGALQATRLKNFLSNEWTRMGGMDYSDVGYDAFLINGKKEHSLFDTATPFHTGEKIRVRIINASSSTYFYASLAGVPLKVVSADGIDITPVEAQEVLMGMAETYDMVYTVPDDRSRELRFTAQDGTGSVSAWLGQGERVYSTDRPAPDLYSVMDHFDHHAEHAAEHLHPPSHAESAPSHPHHVPVARPLRQVPTLTVDDLQSIHPTRYSRFKRLHELKLELGGDMRRYVWWINGRPIQEDRTIEIQEGDLVRMTFVNATMMHHPMHLHGHFFRVLTGAGDRSPLKHTVDVAPHSTRTIEFLANEPGQWMLHCHNLYHLKTGLARVVSYSNFRPSERILQYQKHDPHLHDHVYYRAVLEAASNHAQASLTLSQSERESVLRVESRSSTPWEVEADWVLKSWQGQYWNWGGGVTWFDRRASAILGVEGILPLLVHSHAYVNQAGQLRLGLEKRFQWTSHILSDLTLTWRPRQAQELAKDFEYEFSLMFAPTWSWSAGLMLTDRSLGFGLQYQF